MIVSDRSDKIRSRDVVYEDVKLCNTMIIVNEKCTTIRF